VQHAFVDLSYPYVSVLQFLQSSIRSTLAAEGEWAAALCHDPLPIGGVAVALLLGTYALLGVAPSLPLLVAGFCGVALVYSVDRGVVVSPEDAVNHPGRQRWVREHRRWLGLERVGLLLGGGVALSFLSMKTVLWAGVGALLAGLHLLPAGRWGRPLKRTGLAKPLAVAAAWAVGGTVLPVVEAGGGVSVEVAVLAGYRLLFILPNVLLADWGDRRGDAAAGLRPWADGGRGTGLRWAATGLLGGAAGLAVALHAMIGATGLLLVDALGLLWMGGAVWWLDPERPRHRLLLDLLVAWPLATALAAWGLGGA
jgi:4-hydroxybenzoate polyprenyltransferase